MREIVHKWIQDRLGIVITMSPEMFAHKAKDGHLLSELLKNYEIISDEEMQMIVRSESRKTCLDNFQRHIKNWLGKIGISLHEEEMLQIVNSKSTAALNLFYQAYLELNTKNKLHFLAKQRMIEKMHPSSDKFIVKGVEPSLLDEMPSPKCQHGAALEGAYDIVHWQQDRLEMLFNKCKEAREEYLNYVRSKQNPTGSFMAYNPLIARPDEVKSEIENVPIGSVCQTYEELMMEKRKAVQSTFVPDPNESKRIWAKLHIKQKKHAENVIFKKALERDILKKFWERVDQEEDDDATKNITDILVKQSMFEKQMVQKLGEVKLQKEIMIQNKLLVEDAIAKQREADYVERLILREKEFNESEFTYYLEKERVLRLHRKLYEEKLRLKAKRHYNMCLDAVQDILNVAFKESDYKEQFGEEPSRRIKDMWRKMFVAAVPFDDLVEPLENIVREPEVSENVDDIVHLEIDRQDRIDQQDFESYMIFEWPWELIGIELEENSLTNMDAGLNVLGSLVHNLLVAKYPYPPLPVKPDFPNIEITACVNRFDDINYLPLLQKILAQREVLVVELQDAVNFCLTAYKAEIKVEEDEPLEPDDEDQKGKKGKGKGKGKEKKEKPKKEPKQKKGEKTKAGKSGKGSKGKPPSEPVVVEPATKNRIVQTPRVYPCEEIPLTVQAELGRIADEELSFGRPLTDHLVVAMFIEYLKSEPKIKGWVLINFPATYEQAALLEQALTGLPVPDLSLDLRTNVSINEIAELDQKSEEKPLDENAKYRTSKLLPNPVPEEKPLFYDTALTAFIKVIKKENEEEDLDDTLPPAFKELLNNVNPLEQFYSDLGCNYSFYYEKYDFETVKYLAKLIIGDYSIPIKTSVELFGDSIKYVNADWSTGGDKSQKGGSKVGDKKQKPKPKSAKSEKKDEGTDKKSKGKKEKKEKGGKKGKGKKGGSVVIVHEDKFTQIPEVDEEIVEEIIPVEPPKAGEPCWEYTHFPFPEELQIALASLWENAEDVYKEDFSQVFFLNRIVVNAIMPFVNFVKNHMYTYITRPDDKQYYLREYQRCYNDFENDIRNDEEFKAELHCRINEMRERLFDICDRKMMEAEQERCDLIRKQWGPKQFIEMVNNYINAFQLELDRFVDSLLLVGDYYTAVVTKMPNEVVIAKDQLPKLDAEDEEIIEAVNTLLETVECPTVNENVEGSVVENMYESQQSENYADEENTYENTVTREDNNILNSLPFRQKVEEILNRALEFVHTNQKLANGPVEKVKALFAPQPAKGKKPKSPKKDKKSGKGGNILTLFEPEEIVRQNSERILDEWSCVIRGETERVKIRLNLIMTDLFRNLGEVLTPIRETFHNIYEEIRTRYDNEMDSVKKCCLILTMAVEEEVKIQQELILKDAQFYIDPLVILFPDGVPSVTHIISEINQSGVFTIDQLDKIADILLDLAPSGYIPERYFLFLLQDWIISEDGPVQVPELWVNLEPNGVDKLLKQLFDNIEYIQWKDFIIYNLMVPFPTEMDILEMRKAFRKCDPDFTELVNDYQFLQTKLWFEVSVKDEYRVKLMKNLIFKIYRVRNDKLNYTAMLLDCCKDTNPRIGLVKALELSIGKLLCWDIEIGMQYVEEILSRRNIHDEQVAHRNEEMAENKEMADQILDTLIDKTVHLCDSVVIEDLNPPPELLSDVDTDHFDDHSQSLDGEDCHNNIINYLRKIALENPAEGLIDEINTQISFEVEAAPPLVYFLSLEVLTAVITTSLPWHAKVQNVKDRSFREAMEEVYEKCRNPDFNYAVLAHEFLNHPNFLNVLDRTSRYTAKNPVKIVESILEEQAQENERDNL